ncbi:hypothetical protein [Paenibacillus sp. yr247]|uniref:hypothetical protein n=1 Tax=Paenibacillus sp. yr247 TaxID=1761880 RepID=UPI000B85B874|nr:hypothetical protein [Paenibacillus sp. yr247]
MFCFLLNISNFRFFYYPNNPQISNLAVSSEINDPNSSDRTAAQLAENIFSNNLGRCRYKVAAVAHSPYVLDYLWSIKRAGDYDPLPFIQTNEKGAVA